MSDEEKDINFTDTFLFMSNLFDFDQFKAYAIEQLKAGIPLSGTDLFYSIIKCKFVLLN